MPKRYAAMMAARTPSAARPMIILVLYSDLGLPAGGAGVFPASLESGLVTEPGAFGSVPAFGSDALSSTLGFASGALASALGFGSGALPSGLGSGALPSDSGFGSVTLTSGLG